MKQWYRWALCLGIVILIWSIGVHYYLPSITIGFVGDIMLGRGVAELLQKSPGHDLWGTTKAVLRKQAITLGNLETALTTSTDIVPKVFNFKAHPIFVQKLLDAQILFVNIANNHIRDFGDAGLRETLTTLDKAHIKHVGAGSNAQQAHAPLIYTVKGVRIGIIGYTDNEPDWKATEQSSGTNYSDVRDHVRIQRDIAALKQRVDFVIITVHWGPNMREYPLPEIVACAHAMIDAGADIIHGHSAHVLQGVEWYHQKLILYDTGDFVDDYARDPFLRNDYSCIFQVTLAGAKITQLKLIPVVLSYAQVVLADSRTSEEILALMRKRSQPFGTMIAGNGITWA